MIKINNSGIMLRPSAVDNFFSCSFQWGKVFLEGVNSIPSSRSSIGTSIHAGVEAMWNEAIAKGEKNPNLSMMADAAVQSWQEQSSDGMRYDDGEDSNSCVVEIVKGTEAFVEDIVPFTQIPDAVEKFYQVDLDHPIVAAVGGTVDYIRKDTISDVKTSKRKITASKHTTQQSIYKFLANANGEKVEHNTIQGVILKKGGAEGSILSLEANEPEAKARINIILDTLDLIAKDVAPIETILRPNPGHYLCSPKYCALYPCHAIKEL